MNNKNLKIEFSKRKPLSAKHKQKIGRGVENWWDKNKYKVAGAAAVGAAGLYGLKKYKSGKKLKDSGIVRTKGTKGSASNPVVEKLNVGKSALNPEGGNIRHPQRRAGRTFTDSTGRVRKKGGFLPNFVTDNALVRRARRPIDQTKSLGIPIDVEAERVVNTRNSIHIERQSPNIPFRTNNLNSIEFRARTAEEKRNISRGLLKWWAKQPKQTAKDRGESIGTTITGSAAAAGLGYYGYKNQSDSVKRFINQPKRKTISTAEGLNNALDHDRLAKVAQLHRMAKGEFIDYEPGQTKVGKKIKNLGGKAVRGVLYVGQGMNKLPGPLPAKYLGLIAVTSAGGYAGSKIAEKLWEKGKRKN